jgi:hypothetical protein
MLMSFRIQIGKYFLNTIDSVNIVKSVETLSDLCTIILPASVLNQSVNIEEYIKEDDEIIIWLAYDSTFEIEFKGFVNDITISNSSLSISCEDSLHVFKKELSNVELTNLSLKAVLAHVVKEVDPNFTVKCDYDFNYDKYVIYKATGLDVLKKIQEETKANVYFKDKVLHVHPQYSEIFNTTPVIYDFTKNIEKSNLTYKTADQRKYLLEVESVAADGSRITTTVGKPGGDKRSVKVFGITDIASLKKRAEEELKLVAYAGYEGNFTAWLWPHVEPGYKVRILDNEYLERTGNYYVVAVDTKFSSSGAERTITLGYKIGVR